MVSAGRRAAQRPSHESPGTEPGGEIEFIVPDLFWAELGNVLWKAVRQGRFTARAAEESLRRAMLLEIPTVSSAELVEEAFVIAQQYGRSFHDSCVSPGQVDWVSK